MIRYIFLSAILLFFLNSNAQINPIIQPIENTIYIGVNGNDSNTGDINNPLASFGEAIFRFNYGTGSTPTYNEVVFLEGIHIITNEIRQACWQHYNGTGYKNISIRGINKENTILDGSTSNVVSGNFIELLGSGISIKDITIKLANATDTARFWAAIDFKSAVTPCDTFATNNILIENVLIDGCWDHGINIDGVNMLLVKDCEVTHSNLTNLNGRNDNGSPNSWGSGIKTRLSENIEINNCNVHEIWGEGIATARTTNVFVKNCTVYDTYSVNIYADNAINGSYHSNLCYATIGDDTYWRGSSPSSGFGIAAEYYADNDYAESSNIKMYNNIILNASALFIDDNRPVSEPKNVVLKNLWFCNNSIFGWQGDLQQNLRTIRIDFADYNNNLTQMDSIYLFNNIIGVEPDFIDASGNGQFISGSPNNIPATMYFGNNYWTINPEKFSFYNYCHNLSTDTINNNIPQQIESDELDKITPNNNNELLYEGEVFSFIIEDYFGNLRNNNFNVGAILPENIDTISSIYNLNGNSNLELFPNPSNDFINFIDNLKHSAFIIFNNLGENVKTGNINSNQINITDLNTGVYFIKTEVGIYKFIKN